MPSRPSYREFWKAVTRNGRKPCALYGQRGPCAGPKDAHHFLYKRRIVMQLGKRADAALVDPRNGVCLCRRHHDLVHQGMKPLACPEPPEYELFLVTHLLRDQRRAKALDLDPQR